MVLVRRHKLGSVVRTDLAAGDEERLINGGGRPVALKLFAVNICGAGEGDGIDVRQRFNYKTIKQPKTS